MQPAQTVPIKYVGAKAQKSDNVANTGLVWTPGQVHFVPPSDAFLLMKHPDVWVVPADFDVADVGVALGELPNKRPETPEEEASDPLPRLEQMTKQEIALFSHRRFGLSMDHSSMQKDEMIRNIVVMHNTSMGVNVLDKPAATVLSPEEIRAMVEKQGTVGGLQPRVLTVAEDEKAKGLLVESNIAQLSASGVATMGGVEAEGEGKDEWTDPNPPPLVNPAEAEAPKVEANQGEAPKVEAPKVVVRGKAKAA